jgi:hypothetical protein
VNPDRQRADEPFRDLRHPRLQRGHVGEDAFRAVEEQAAESVSATPSDGAATAPAECSLQRADCWLVAAGWMPSTRGGAGHRPTRRPRPSRAGDEAPYSKHIVIVESVYLTRGRAHLSFAPNSPGEVPMKHHLAMFALAAIATTSAQAAPQSILF